MKPRCNVDGCKNDASWRQYDPVDEDRPIYLCTPHWNDERITDIDHSARYGPLHLFPAERAAGGS
jgi:hypothetical protein